MDNVDCSADAAAVVASQSGNTGVLNTPILSVRQNIGHFSANKEVLVNVALSRDILIEAYQLELDYDTEIAIAMGKISLKHHPKVTAYPNPTSDELNFSVQLEQGGEKC